MGRCLIVCAVVCGIGSALSAQSVPYLAQVTGVEQDDTLNIRAMPDPRSDDIGDLAPLAVTEVLELSDNGRWARIIAAEGDGWIATQYLQQLRRPTGQNGAPLDLFCSGTEPFWGLNIAANETVAFETPDKVEVATPITAAVRSSSDGGISYGYATRGMSVIVRRAVCSDGMSDRTYGWSADVLRFAPVDFTAPNLLSGCCVANVVR